MTLPDPVLFLSFGGPEKEEEILPFLESVTRGRRIPRERLAGVAEHYRRIGGKSPINQITRRQADLLRRALESAGDARAVYVGQRHSAPLVESALRKMAEDGIKRAVGFCAAAFRCEASLERYVAAVEEARAKIGARAPRVDFVGPWFNHPRLISAVRERILELAPPKEAPWVFTAHSIPCAMARESNYVEELREAAALVARAGGRADWSLAFTSRSGRPADAWLEPDVSKVIRAKASEGVRDLVLVPIGFVADHVEVLYDLDVEAKAAADEAGVRLHRAKTVGDHPLFIDMIADVVSRPAPADPALGRSSAAKAPPAAKPCYCFPGDPEAPCLRA